MIPPTYNETSTSSQYQDRWDWMQSEVKYLKVEHVRQKVEQVRKGAVVNDI